MQYESTWQTYLEKYESHSLAKELRGIEQLWNEVKEKNNVSQKYVMDLKSEIENLKIMKGNDNIKRKFREALKLQIQCHFLDFYM